ncbi:MAG: diacylglycerol/lipid kinase family protein [Christensenellales bacterium]|jgi:diacylglycerol kinase (ATP)
MEMISGKRVLLIINPVAGRRLGIKSADEICAQLRAGGFAVDQVETAAAGDAVRISREGSHYYDIIACAGGDGTLHEVINGVMAEEGEKRPEIMYFPSGTTNVAATSMGLTGLPRSVISKVVNGAPRPYDIGSFTGAGQSRHFTFMATFGAFSNVSYETSQNLKNILGYFAYLLQGIKNLAELKSYEVNIKCGDAKGDCYERADRIIFGNVSNSRSMAGIFKIEFESLRLDDGLFEAMFIKAPRNLLELERIISCLLAGQYDDEYISFYQASSISIRTPQEIEWGLDGEFAGIFSDVQVRALKGAVQIYR